ncbi:MAG TPA: YciI family protein [candidate division Zixibacteria bacterium]|nr:YciI family protein [candidate division Zixibacteria bacterium]
MPEFMFLIREDATKQSSPRQGKEIVEKFMAWAGQLRERGKFKGGDEVQSNGRILSMPDGNIVESPFVPAGDSVAGYFLIEADDYAEATQIARECPGLHYGDSIEIRQISDYK